MTGFRIITLDDLSSALGEESLNHLLLQYSCPRNSDIESFLHHNAVPFSRQGIAKTHLVFAGFHEKAVLVGYFTLASKTLYIPDRVRLSASLRKRLSRFSARIDETHMTVIAAPLIAQLGKNYQNGYDALITGDELLGMACDTIQRTQLAIGGKVAYLECEDIPGLVRFYESNGFQRFSERESDNHERLIQMIRYF